MKNRLLACLLLPCLPSCVQLAAHKSEIHAGFSPIHSPSEFRSPPVSAQVPLKAVPPPAPTSVWKQSGVVHSQELAAGARFHEFTAQGSGQTVEVSVVIFDSQSCALKVLDQPSANAGAGVLNTLMQQAGAIAGINGGFFHPDFSALGIIIADGRKTGQFTRSSLVSGALVVIRQEPYLVWNAEFLGEKAVTQMLQAGPRLVDAGRALATLNATKHSARSFIATDGHRQWAIGTVHRTTLAGLGEMLASDGLLPGMQVQRALNLDGGRSTALYVKHADGHETSRSGWSTVRNYVAVIPR